jgi:hypothetical protein
MVVVNDSLNEADAGGMEFSLWLAKVGLSRPTGYRYRRDKKLVAYNLEGREFILTEEIARFWQRVKAGEFAKKPRGASLTSYWNERKAHEIGVIPISSGYRLGFWRGREERCQAQFL